MRSYQTIPVAKPPVLWILVADGRTAQVYVRERVERHIPMPGNSRRHPVSQLITHEPVPVKAMRWKAEAEESYDLGRHPPAMVYQSRDTSRSMSGPGLDVHDEIRQHLARKVADGLNRAYARHAFDRLVLAAAPKMLGELKHYLEPAVLSCVTAELPKDLTHLEGAALERHLEEAGV